ncbi:MAG: CotH kinase family protein, partial [Planctomycetota bacterium]
MFAPALSSPFAALALVVALTAQDPQGPPPGGGFPGGGFPGPGGPGGPGGMNQATKVKERFDADKNGRLDRAERQEARAWLKENRPQRGMRGPGGRAPGGPGGAGGEANRSAEPKVGGRVTPADVPSHAGRPLFDPDIVRTFFVEFEDADWYEQLTEFHRTDVEVPATVTVDGTTYRDVGVQFRGNTSFGMAPGKKKSIDFTFDLVDKKQSLLGVRNLDLLNCNADPSSLREAIHGWVANQFLPAPRTALARTVICGEDFGVYCAVQQFDKEFVADHFGTKQGDRFKVPPDFSGNGGLRFLGDDPAAYRRSYELKSGESEAAWLGLVDVCAAIANAPADRLEAILPQHLDVDGMLWFLAIDNALADDDGYFSRASDYLLYRDPKGRFHAIPRDNNEVLLAARGRGPGGPVGPGGQPAPGGPGDNFRPGPPPDGGAPGGPGAQGGPPQG